jgi:hypothetical protein
MTSTITQLRIAPLLLLVLACSSSPGRVDSGSGSDANDVAAMAEAAIEVGRDSDSATSANFPTDTTTTTPADGPSRDGFDAHDEAIVDTADARTDTPIDGPPLPRYEIRDKFGRALNDVGVTLVDWDGQVANPVVVLTILAPSTVAFPAQATLSSGSAMLYFDRTASVGNAGSVANLTFARPGDVATVQLGLWPDHDAVSESYTLSLSGGGVSTTIPVRVVDQDLQDLQPAGSLQVTLDLSQDTDGFFADPSKRQVADVAAQDWAYFFDTMNLDPVAVHTQETDCISTAGNVNPLVWRTNIWNTSPYTGFLFYMFGVHTITTDPNKLISGGAPSYFAGYQSSGGVPLPAMLRRSGAISVEETGNYNSLGWLVSSSDATWWTSENLGNEQNDLLSIVHHEMGHALLFNAGYANFGAAKTAGAITDARVVAYYGGPVPIDIHDHFAGVIDPASGLGAFGNEYADTGTLPRRRWMTTKLDLLAAQAVGYVLRPTSAFLPLALASTALPSATIGQVYQGDVTGTGGVPTYRFSTTAGTLPPGLALDSFSGRISGVPTLAGSYDFTVALADIGVVAATTSSAFSIVVLTP